MFFFSVFTLSECLLSSFLSLFTLSECFLPPFSFQNFRSSLQGESCFKNTFKNEGEKVRRPHNVSTPSVPAVFFFPIKNALTAAFLLQYK